MAKVELEVIENEAKKTLEKYENIELKPKDRLLIPIQDMPNQDPAERITNMNEVALGYTESQVKVESLRCLQCKNAPCIQGCPVGINIPLFIEKAAQGDFAGSVAVIRESSMLPAICGRVCPQESQCQLTCTVGKSLKSVEKAVNIGRIERYVADWESENNV
ncbi:MAG: dihydropyrimidine dehydrogenase, partial [Sphaerochaetaceae bacterium]